MERLNAQLWETFSQELERLNHATARVKISYSMLNDTNNFAFSNGAEFVPMFTIQQGFDTIAALDAQAKALNISYALIQQMRAGAQVAGNDFNIVADPAVVSAEDIKAGTVRLDEMNRSGFNLGIAPFIIVAGVAVVAMVTGAIATVSYLNVRAQELETKIAEKQMELEQGILQNPSILPAWTQYKRETVEQKQSVIDRLFGEGSGKSILGGAAGLAIVLLGGWFLMQYIKGKNAAAN